jgi:hypothetical protein
MCVNLQSYDWWRICVFHVQVIIWLQVYLQITNPELCQDLFDRALEKLNTGDVDAFVKESVLDLLRALLPYQDKSRLAQLYSCCEARLTNTKNLHEQKKAYR